MINYGYVSKQYFVSMVVTDKALHLVFPTLHIYLYLYKVIFTLTKEKHCFKYLLFFLILYLFLLCLTRIHR